MQILLVFKSPNSKLTGQLFFPLLLYKPIKISHQNLLHKGKTALFPPEAPFKIDLCNSV